MDYIILYATAIISKNKPNTLKIFIASFIGAIYAVLVYLIELSIFSNIILKIILSVIMVSIAYNVKNIKKIWKQLILFYLTSFVFGGVALAIINIVNENNLKLEIKTIKIILFSGIIGFVIVTISFKLVKTKISKKDMFCNIEIKLDKKIIKTNAMMDTGNLLKEPITNIPVIIVEHTLLYESIPKDILNNLENILAGKLDGISDEIKNNYLYKLKLIPYTSLGKQNGMLIGIKADEVKLYNEYYEKKLTDVIIGIYNRSLTKRGEYRALLGIEII